MLAPRVIDRITVAVALAGGGVLLGLAGMVVASVTGRWLAGGGVPGDFELVQTGLALAVFAFLPLCQLRGANLMVGTFTDGLPPRVRGALDALWALLYAGVAALVGWRLVVGALDTMRSGTRSMVLGLPLGWAMGVGAVLLAWLAVVALVTVRRLARGAA